MGYIKIPWLLTKKQMALGPRAPGKNAKVYCKITISDPDKKGKKKNDFQTVKQRQRRDY